MSRCCSPRGPTVGAQRLPKLTLLFLGACDDVHQCNAMKTALERWKDYQNSKQGVALDCAQLDYWVSYKYTTKRSILETTQKTTASSNYSIRTQENSTPGIPHALDHNPRTSVETEEAGYALRSLPSVSTTHCTAPRSSFNGVQCSMNFSKPMYGRAHNLSSTLTAFPTFNPDLMVLLKSQLSEPLPWLARKRKTSTPMAGVEKVALLL